MNKTTLDYISSLSLLDSKSMNSKTNKLFEEGGELAKKVLAFSDAQGSRHKFVTPEGILEEIADIILVVRSMAYELKFSHQDIEEMIKYKADKWASLMESESRMGDEIPYEIHITIEEAGQDEFLSVCKNLDVKPIVLALHAGDEFIKDVMTSSVYMGSNSGAYIEMERISKGLAKAGFKVLREKIETVPWHTAAPSRKYGNLEMPKDCYFESHLGIKMTGCDKEKTLLEEVCKSLDCHLSRNFFKKRDDGSFTIMATYRKYNGVSEDFISSVKAISSELNSLGFNVEKVITEFSIFDTRVSHDYNWINK